MSIEQADYIQVTSYDCAGVAQDSVERFVVASDQRLGWWQPDQTEALQRFADGVIVSVQACHGKKPAPAEPVLQGRVSMIKHGPIFAEIKAAMSEKYKFQVGLSAVLDKAKELVSDKTEECVVLIEITG